MKTRFFPTILREQPEAGGGASAPAPAASAPPTPAAAAPAANAGAPAPAGQAAAPVASPSPYRPEGLPDHLFGKTDRETIDALARTVDGFRRAQAERGETPKDAAGYVFEASEALRPYADGLAKDPFFDRVKAAAHKHGLPTKVFNGFLNDIMGEMVAGKMVGEAYDPERERAALMPDVTDAGERTKAVDALVRENIARIAAFQAQGLPEGAAKWMVSQLDRAAANQALGFFLSRMGEQAPALGGQPPSGAMTDKQLDDMMADPRGKAGHAKYDPAFAASRDAAFKARFGA